MRNISKAGILMVAAITAASIGAASAAGAQEDLDCGDPGTHHMMPVSPDDPHGLDRDGNGFGCEDASVFDQPPATEPPPPAPQTTAAPAPAPLPAPAPPAVPVTGEPDFTG